MNWEARNTVVMRQKDELAQAKAIVDKVEQAQIKKCNEKGSRNSSRYCTKGLGENAYCLEET